MADLNALIAQGAQFRQPESPLNMMAQLQQLQSAQNQNALAQYQLGAAQRADVSKTALNQAYVSAVDPVTSKIDYTKLTSALAAGGGGAEIPGLLKQKREGEKAASEAAKAEVDLVDAKLKQSRGMLDTVNTPEQYLAWHEANHNDSVLGPVLAARGVTADVARKQIESALQQPGGFEQLLNQSKLGAEKFIEMNKPTVHAQDTNAGGQLVSIPGLGGAATVVPGSSFAKTMTPGEAALLPVRQQTANAATQNAATSAGQLKVSQGNLAVNQSNLGINRAGLAIRAIGADPYNISGVQAAFPLPGATVTGTPSTTQKQPSGAPVVQNAAAAVKAGLTGEDLLTHLPPTLASQIRAIGEGREASPAARSLTTPAGRQLMDMVNAAYPNYDAKQYATIGQAEKAFTSGKKGDTARSFNVAIDHLGTLQQVADALQNGDTRLFNQAGNFVALQTGQTAPTDFNAVKRIVGDEINKAVLGGAGALGDRKAVDDAISSANSPAQLTSVINRYKNLMSGQVTGLEQQYTASTGKKDFRDRFLTPATKAALGTAVPAATGGVDTSNKWLK